MTELSDIIQLPASDEEKERHIATLERGGFSEEELETASALWVCETETDMVAPDLFDPARPFLSVGNCRRRRITTHPWPQHHIVAAIQTVIDMQATLG